MVSSVEANVLENKISIEYPVGKALLGKRVGDTVLITTESSKYSVRVVKVS